MAHFVTKIALSRRTFLRGTGAALALPWLDAMVPACQPLAPGPTRVLFVFSPNGMKMDDWTPRGTGSAFELGYTLAPLAPHRAVVTVLSGLALDGARAKGDGPGDHARAGGAFLTCTHPKKTGGAEVRAGISIDQVLAKRLCKGAAFPSLELGMEPGRAAGACDSGYSCAYTSHIAWKDESTPIAKETDPTAAFARLFGDPEQLVDPDRAAREREKKKSLLDAVLADANALAGNLGSADRAKLDAYLSAVRELEVRLAQVRERAKDVGVPKGLLQAQSYPERLDLMYEILALAFSADLVRVATFMLGNAGSNLSYPLLEVPEGHHDLSHHGKKPEKLGQLRKVNRFQVERFAKFVARLKELPDADGKLIDKSCVMLGSGIGDGDRHNHDDLPIVVAGRGLSLRGNQHLVVPRETPLANLYLTLAQRGGVEVERFGDSWGGVEAV